MSGVAVAHGPLWVDPAHAWLPLLPLVLGVAVYGVGTAAMRRRGDRWPGTRTVAAAAGLGCLAAALAPPIATQDEYFPVHVVQHLLLASVGPALLALSAPVTLALRTTPPAMRVALLRLARSRTVRALTHPVSVVSLNLGVLYAFYLTPLFGAVEERRALHVLMHVHMFAAGWLLAWYLIAVDPLPRPSGVRTRLAVLVAVAGAHDLLAKLMYAHVLPSGGGTVEEIHAGARVMFYGGDVIEVLLAVVLLAGWYARTGREIDRTRRRRAASRPTALPGPW
jgi:putative membrane protein